MDAEDTRREESIMRFISFVRSDEANPVGTPPPELFEAMGEFAQEAAANGTLVDQGGLLPSSAGAIVSLVDDRISTVDGPFTEAKELIGGYAVLDVRSKEEAVQLARRMLELHRRFWPGWEGMCEVRQMQDASNPHPDHASPSA